MALLVFLLITLHCLQHSMGHKVETRKVIHMTKTVHHDSSSSDEGIISSQKTHNFFEEHSEGQRPISGGTHSSGRFTSIDITGHSTGTQYPNQGPSRDVLRTNEYQMTEEERRRNGGTIQVNYDLSRRESSQGGAYGRRGCPPECGVVSLAAPAGEAGGGGNRCVAERSGQTCECEGNKCGWATYVPEIQGVETADSLRIKMLQQQWRENWGNSGRSSGRMAATSNAGWSNFQGFYYKVLVAQLDHAGAEAACQREGSHLASFHSAEEKDFAWQLILQTGQRISGDDKMFSDGVFHGWYFGMIRPQLNYMKDRYNPRWTDGTVMDFGCERSTPPQMVRVPNSPWSMNQPSYYNNPAQPIGSKIEECGHYWPAGHSVEGQWNDIMCDVPLTGAVCKKVADD